MIMEYQHTNKKGLTYYLNSKQVKLRGGRLQTIFYFTKDRRDTACPIPDGRVVVENPRNGFLTLKKVA
jgi:hypothetical protein